MKLPRWLVKAGEWLCGAHEGRSSPQHDDEIEFIDGLHFYDLGIDPEIEKGQRVKDWCVATKILSQDAIEFLRGEYGACSEDMLIERFETLIEEIEKIEEGS